MHYININTSYKKANFRLKNIKTLVKKLKSIKLMILSIYSLLNDTPIIENNANIRIATGIPVFAKSDEEVVA